MTEDKLHYATPYSLEKNIGREYNNFCRPIPDEDWICIRDGDTMFLQSDWGHFINTVIAAQNDRVDGACGLMGCMTNRLNPDMCYHQLVGYACNPDMDVMNHKQIAIELRERHGTQVIEYQLAAGCFLLFKRKTWAKVGGFTEIEWEQPFFDQRFSSAMVNAGEKVGIIQGLYIFHMYRTGNPYDYSHLTK